MTDTAYLLPDAPPPSWDDLRDAGCMLIDHEYQKVAIYASEAGAVVFVSASLGDEQATYQPLEPDDVPKLIDALINVSREARATERRRDAEIARLSRAADGLVLIQGGRGA